MMRADQGPGCKHLVEVVAADDMPEHQYAGEQAEPGGRRDNQRHARAIPRLRNLMPVADQQEGEEARQFPKKPAESGCLKSTMPSIAPMKASRNEKKRRTGSAGDME
jgi:hypothetical protein